MVLFLKRFILCLMLFTILLGSGCVSCLPQYTAPPDGPVSRCYPTGHDPYIPMDHNPSLFHFWDLVASVTSPFIYGPPR
jgi:hypothetical protein